MFSENLDVYFNEFAVIATLPDATEIKVLFDKVSDDMNSVDSEGLIITATCQTSDIENLNHEDMVVINGTNYFIVNIYATMDGLITKLVLRE